MGSYVSRSIVLAIAACLLASAAPAGADALPLPADPAARTAGWSTAGPAPADHNTSFPNGDFEAGNFTGWSTVDTGDGAWSVYSGTPAFPAPPPPQGNFAAVTDQGAPGTHLLMRDIAVPSAGNATLSFILYYTNNAGTFWTPDTLDHNSSGPNQQYRVDLMTTTSPVDSVAPGDVVAMLYRTEVGAPATLAPTTLAYDLSAYAGQTLRLRFAEVDNQGNFWASVDDVRFGNATPPPPPGAPDLVVLDVTLDPAAPEPGQGVVFTAILRNVGSGTAGPSTVFFQIDSPDGPATFVGAPSLAPGQTVSVSTSPSPGMDQGNHTITAVADVDNAVAEADETNNEFVRSFHVGPIGPAADLAVSSDDIRITKRMLRTDYTDPLVNPLAGADIDVTVRNVGPEGALHSSLLIEACGSPPAFPSVRPPCQFIDLVPLPPLAPGGSVDVSAFWDTRASLGDVEIVASIQYFLPQESYENDVARKATFVVVGGTGLGGISV